MMRNATESEVTTPRVLGIDDWAFRKGQSYGTILVDLENRQPVDLLPDREATSVEQWLKSHPGVEIISRDRGTFYIKGATDGAPAAIQVADRWHLLKNIRETLQRLLETKPDCLKAAAESDQGEQSTTEETIDEQPSETETMPAMTDKQQTHEQSMDEPKELTQSEKVQLQRRKRRLQRYTLVKKLKLQGCSIREIARRTQISRQTVTKYARNNRRLRLTVKSEECPQYPRGINRKSKLEPYKDYITQRLKDGCYKATRIFNELRQRGFVGSYSTVVRWVRTEIKSLQVSGSLSPPKEVVPWSPRRAAWLLVKPQEELDDDESLSLQRMLKASDTVACAHTLGQRFSAMIKERDCEALLPWLKDATESGIDALKQFAKGIKQDIDAVNNALRYEWSQGQVEGQVNRLKLIKRQMYGRANFDLLRKRVLFNPI
jgi:transposase